MLLSSETIHPNDGHQMNNGKYAVTIANADIGWLESIDLDREKKGKKQKLTKSQTKHKVYSSRATLYNDGAAVSSSSSLDSIQNELSATSKDTHLHTIFCGVNLFIEKVRSDEYFISKL